MQLLHSMEWDKNNLFSNQILSFLILRNQFLTWTAPLRCLSYIKFPTNIDINIVISPIIIIIIIIIILLIIMIK